MKKFSVTILFILFTLSIYAQKNFYTEFLKEIIVARTLIAENRISEFSEFLDEKSYVSVKENIFSKFSLVDEPHIFDVGFIIRDNNDLLAFISKKGDDGIQFEISKRELFLIWKELFESIQTGLPYSVFIDLKQQLEEENKVTQKMNFEIINRYEFRAGDKNKPNEWETYKASNFTTMMSNDKFLYYTFLGPGKIDYINLIFNKYSEENWEDNVEVVFLVQAVQITEDYIETEFLNIPFFMSLKNFNDRIWQDN